MTAEENGRWLLIETSGGSGRVGVAEGDRLLGERRLDEARRHARDLAPAVRDLLAEQGWKPAEITAVFASAGPGSYTGLRVGLMSAKAFAYATGCGVLGVETFEVLAAATPPQPLPEAGRGLIEVIADAQQQKLYCQRFEIDRTRALPRAVTDLAVLPVAEWLARVQELPSAPLVTGPGVGAYRPIWPDWLRLADESERQPSLGALLRVGLAHWRRGERGNLWKLEPIYLRPSSAEEKWRR